MTEGMHRMTGSHVSRPVRSRRTLGVLAAVSLALGGVVAVPTAAVSDTVTYSASGYVEIAASTSGMIAELTRVVSGSTVVVSQAPVTPDHRFALPGGTVGTAHKISVYYSGDQANATFWSDSSGTSLYFSSADRNDLTINVPTLPFSSTAIILQSGNLGIGDSILALFNFVPAASFDTLQWYRNGQPISGATTTSYTVTAADQGTNLTFIAIGSKRGYSTTPGYSPALYIPPAAVVPAAATPPAVTAVTSMSVAKPKISGTAKVGKVLSATASKVSGAKVTFQWFANGKKVKKATKSRLTLTRSLAGKRVSAVAIYTKTGYLTTAKASKSTAVIKK